ncbi:MAG: response regulator [Verrucomicrobia bacterium]|nr:response regulator [Verrucomicrobiota bacterium]
MNAEVEILLVEDNPADEELTLTALREKNLANKIMVARDGAEALDILFGKDGGTPAARPRVILLDLKLPKVDGLQVLRKVKTDERTRTIPVVVLTSSREERDVVESYSLGVNSFITKPVDFDQFLKSVGDIGLYWMLMNIPPRH